MSDHWSIGEVLSLLQTEFPEVTISKIRFLESQGLISPERTPSGYRRFYQDDFDRLRWILEQQRDHYLPLKVIRRRLESGEFEAEQQQLDMAPAEGPASAEETGPAEETAPAEETVPTGETVPAGETAPAEQPAPTGQTAPAEQPVPTGQVPPAEPRPEVDVESVELDPRRDESEAERLLAGVGAAADGATTGVRSSDRRRSANADPDPELNVALTREELVEASGCDATLLTDLERYGIVVGRTIGPTVLYDGEALEIARLASRFASHGLDARHLRTLRIGAEREVGLVFQIVEPMLHRRRPEAQRESIETLDELVAMTTALRTIFIDQLVREQLPNPRG